MKITDVEAIILRYRDRIQDIADGTQDALIVRVRPDEGIVGIGEVDSSPLALGVTLDEAVLRRYRVDA